jgi:hypothetical protein
MPIRPHSIAIAVQAIWISLAMDAFTMLASFDGVSNQVDALTFNAMMLTLYGLVTFKIASGRDWARRVYAVLVAMELALLAAFGVGEASELEVLVTYLTLPLEIWILFKLYSAESDAWFKAVQADRSDL